MDFTYMFFLVCYVMNNTHNNAGEDFTQLESVWGEAKDNLWLHKGRGRGYII